MVKLDEIFMAESIQEHLQKNERPIEGREIQKKQSKPENRIQMADFYGIYPQEEINRDINATIRQKEVNKLEDAKDGEDINAKKLEAGIVCQAINAFQFFGENVHIMRASLWDDYFRGVDAIAEVEVADQKNIDDKEKNKRQFIALSIDAVKAAGRTLVKEKIDNNLRKLEGNGQEIKYGKSFDGKYKGKLTDVLPVVLGLEDKNVEKFFGKMEALSEAGKNKQQDPSEQNQLVYKALYLELMRDPVQLTMIKEIIMQMEYYKNYFKNNEKVLRKYATAFDETLATFKDIEKLANRKSSSALKAEDDSVFKSIRDVCGQDYRAEEYRGARVYHA